MKVPHGLEDAQLDIMTNEHASTRHRIGKDGPLVEGRQAQARHARPRRQGDRDRPVRRADHRHQRHDEGRPAGQGLQGRRRVHRARPEYRKRRPPRGRREEEGRHPGRAVRRPLPHIAAPARPRGDRHRLGRRLRGGEPEADPPRGEDRRGDLRAGAKRTQGSGPMRRSDPARHLRWATRPVSARPKVPVRRGSPTPPSARPKVSPPSARPKVSPNYPTQVSITIDPPNPPARMPSKEVPHVIRIASQKIHQPGRMQGPTTGRRPIAPPGQAHRSSNNLRKARPHQSHPNGDETPARQALYPFRSSF